MRLKASMEKVIWCEERMIESDGGRVEEWRRKRVTTPATPIDPAMSTQKAQRVFPSFI